MDLLLVDRTDVDRLLPGLRVLVQRADVVLLLPGVAEADEAVMLLMDPSLFPVADGFVAVQLEEELIESERVSRVTFIVHVSERERGSLTDGSLADIVGETEQLAEGLADGVIVVLAVLGS